MVDGDVRGGAPREGEASAPPPADVPAMTGTGPGGAGKPSFLSEFRRRHLFRTSSAYLLGAFAVLQGVDMVRAHLDLPTVLIRIGLVIAVLGFPLNLFLAWQAYDTDDDPWTIFARKLPRPTWILVGVLAVAAGGVAAWRVWGGPSAPPRTLTVLVADLQNQTGEGVFETLKAVAKLILLELKKGSGG